MNKRQFLQALSLPSFSSLLAACGGGAGTGVEPVDLSPASIANLGAIEAARLLHAGRLTSEQLTQAYLERIQRHRSYNAFTYLDPQALKNAQQIDERRRRGDFVGPLSGLPIVIKETMDWVGTPSTMGWHRLASRAGGRDLFPRANATVVQRLLDAGAVILGKTNIPAFSDNGTRASSSWAGPTLNAIDRNLAPGASSAGTATAVAAAFAAVGLGEETGGSIQNPAAAQSLVGLKPTFGLVPTQGVVPLAASTRDVVGPIARCVADAAFILDVLRGGSGNADAQDSPGRLSATALGGRRIGLYGPGWKEEPLTPLTQKCYERACAELSARGATLVADPFNGSGFAQLALAGEPYDYRGTESAAHDLAIYLRGLGFGSFQAFVEHAGASPFDADQPLNWYANALPILRNSLIDPTAPLDLSEFRELRDKYISLFNRVMDENQLDALAFPHSTAGTPSLAGSDVFSETTVSAVNIAGLPCITVPAGTYEGSGAPFSLVIVGRPWSETLLLNLAYDYEQSTRHRIAPVLA